MKLPDLSGGPRDEREVVGLYKMAGITDPDQIYAMKLDLMRPGSHRMKSAKWQFLALLAFAIALVLTGLGIIVVPFVLVAMIPLPFVYFNGRRLTRIVERGTQAYCDAIGIRSP